MNAPDNLEEFSDPPNYDIEEGERSAPRIAFYCNLAKTVGGPVMEIACGSGLVTIPIAAQGLDIVCFRFNPGGLDDEKLNALNKEILMQLHERGIAAPSYTTLDGRYCLRIAIANHRSRMEDFDLLAREVVRIGREVVAQIS